MFIDPKKKTEQGRKQNKGKKNPSNSLVYNMANAKYREQGRFAWLGFITLLEWNKKTRTTRTITTTLAV